MKRKIIAGAVAMALTLTTGITVYAASTPKENESTNNEVHQNEILKDDMGSIPFDNIDKNNLPDGVTYEDEISMNGEGSISFDNIDKDDLPDGITYKDEISLAD